MGQPKALLEHSDSYISAMERLIDVIQDLSHARNISEIVEIVRKAARELTGSDGSSFVLRDGDQCYYADEDAISPLWKGQRFPMNICVSGWVMQNGANAIIEDIYKDARIPIDAYKVTFVKSLTMVPIRKDSPVGAIGNYWSTTHKSNDEEITVLQALANATSIAIENADLYEKLQKKINAAENSNKELKRFAWATSHELKPPLEAIKNLATWTKEGIEQKRFEECKEHLKIMQARAVRMQSLIDDFYNYAYADRN